MDTHAKNMRSLAQLMRADTENDGAAKMIEDAADYFDREIAKRDAVIEAHLSVSAEDADEIEKLTEELAKSREAAAQLTQMVNSRQLALNMAIGEREQAKEAAMALHETLTEEGYDRRDDIASWPWLEDGEL